MLQKKVVGTCVREIEALGTTCCREQRNFLHEKWPQTQFRSSSKLVPARRIPHGPDAAALGVPNPTLLLPKLVCGPTLSSPLKSTAFRLLRGAGVVYLSLLLAGALSVLKWGERAPLKDGGAEADLGQWPRFGNNSAHMRRIFRPKVISWASARNAYEYNAITLMSGGGVEAMCAFHCTT